MTSPNTSGNNKQQEYMTVFIDGKKRKIKRSVVIGSFRTDEFIQQNADLVWLHENKIGSKMCVLSTE